VPFLYHNRPGKSYPLVKDFFKALREGEGAALPVGAAGFCWGGKHTVLLAADVEKVGGKPLLDAGFTGHPSMLSIPGDIENMSRPVSFAVGEKDSALSMQQAEQIKQIVEAKPDGQRGELVVYPGVGHGFCVRADTAILDVAKQAAEAEDQCIRWFDKHFGLAS
jgi:dienelactone hydrolase